MRMKAIATHENDRIAIRQRDGEVVNCSGRLWIKFKDIATVMLAICPLEGDYTLADRERMIRENAGRLAFEIDRIWNRETSDAHSCE